MAKNNTKKKKDGFFLSGKLDVTFLSFVMIFSPDYFFCGSPILVKEYAPRRGALELISIRAYFLRPFFIPCFLPFLSPPLSPFFIPLAKPFFIP